LPRPGDRHADTIPAPRLALIYELILN
jgi:hypothetical protein